MTRVQSLVIALAVLGIGPSAAAWSADQLTPADTPQFSLARWESGLDVASAAPASDDARTAGLDARTEPLRRLVTPDSVVVARESSAPLLLLFLAIGGVSAVAWRHFPRE